MSGRDGISAPAAKKKQTERSADISNKLSCRWKAMPTTNYSKVKVTREAQEDAKSRAKPKGSQIPFQPWEGYYSKSKVLSNA